MVENEMYIYEIINERPGNIEIDSHMTQWYVDVLNKKQTELTVFDVIRMIIQKTLTEIALERSLEILLDDPIAGSRFDGELLVLISTMEMKYIERHKESVNEIVNSITKEQISEFEWLSTEAQDRFVNALNDLKRKFNDEIV